MPVTQLQSHRTSRPRRSSIRHRRHVGLENLEPRNLMSATWNTIDTFQLAASGAAYVKALTVDAQGNQYAVGYAKDSAGVQHGIVRQSLAGSGTWNTIYDSTTISQFWGLALDAQGDLFVCGRSTAGPACVYERPAGSTQFSQVEKTSGTGQYYAMTSDTAGNVYVVGVNTVSTRNNSESHWIVEKWTPSTAKFQTVDDFTAGMPTSNRSARGISVVPTGPAAGLYVVGESVNSGSGGLVHWTVRKGTLDASSWSTVDDFLYDSMSSSSAYGVAGDSIGNVYVVGMSNTTIITGYKGKTPLYAGGPSHWIVRKSASGNLGTWGIIDDQAPANSSSNVAYAVTADALGNVHVAGSAFDGTLNHSIVRTLSAGTWTTVDDFTDAGSYALTVDSSGALYTGGAVRVVAGGPVVWCLRSNAAVPSIPAPLTSSLQLTAIPTLSTTTSTRTHQSIKPLSTLRS